MPICRRPGPMGSEDGPGLGFSASISAFQMQVVQRGALRGQEWAWARFKLQYVV